MVANNGIKIGLKAYDDLFKTDEGRKAEEIIPVQLSELKPFSEQPFKVLEDDSMTELVESIKENGENRLKLKYNENGGKFRNIKSYEYHLIIDKYIIYQEKIFYNKATIRKAQEKAKTVFLEICKEIDRREKLKMNQNQFNLKDILDYLKIKYSELK